METALVVGLNKEGLRVKMRAQIFTVAALPGTHAVTELHEIY